jgi:hypothetical protein
MTAYSPRDVLDRVWTDWRCALHTAFPAKVVAYDAALQVVDVSPALLREVPTDVAREPWAYEALPDPLVHVPILWPRGGGFALTFPLAVGDWVLVVCAEQATLLWRQTGAVGSEPGLCDPLGLNGLVAMPGWFPDASKLQGVSTTDLVLGTEDGATAVRIKPDGTVHVGAEGVPLALATLVKSAMQALGDALTTTAAALPDPSAKAAVQAVASTVDAWAGAMDVGAEKARGI